VSCNHTWRIAGALHRFVCPSCGTVKDATEIIAVLTHERDIALEASRGKDGFNGLRNEIQVVATSIVGAEKNEEIMRDMRGRNLGRQHHAGQALTPAPVTAVKIRRRPKFPVWAYFVIGFPLGMIVSHFLSSCHGW
jgi:hypothetical protein